LSVVPNVPCGVERFQREKSFHFLLFRS